MSKPVKRRNGLARFLLDPLIKRLIVLALVFFVLAPMCQAFVNEFGEKIALAAEATERFFLSPSFGPDDVLLSPELLELAQKEGIDPYDLQSIIAAAASEEDKGKGIDKYTFAAHLLGLAKVETSYCHNLGGGIAKKEIDDRLQKEKDAGNDTGFWEAQVEAIKDIASRLWVDVNSIPGSVGAGAISCFQLMPSNWLQYGGGDYRDTYSAALNSARFLKAHSYPDMSAIGSYNPGAGQEYVDKVLEYSETWMEPVTTALVMLPEPINYLTVPQVFFEYLAWYIDPNSGLASGGVPGEIPGVSGQFVNPHPGSHPCGNWYGRVIGRYVHMGQDLCLGGATGEVIAAHDCVVTLAQLINRRSSDAITWSSSGNTVVCAGALPDGRIVESIYGHLDGSDLPAVGKVFTVGDHLGKTLCSGNTDVEYCSGHHLHLGFKIDGEFVNPLSLIP